MGLMTGCLLDRDLSGVMGSSLFSLDSAVMKVTGMVLVLGPSLLGNGSWGHGLESRGRSEDSANMLGSRLTSGST